MKMNRLGDTSLTVSEIGFGTWGLGGSSYGPIDEKSSLALLRTALEKGINFYDTSDLYGEGRSECLIGKALGADRDSLVYATKGGTLPHTGFRMPQDFSRKHLSGALEGSLKRLGTDYVDLYQLHSPTLEDVEKHDCLGTLDRFKREGKIREYGISVRTPMDGNIAITTFGFKIVQVNYNLIDHRAVDCGLFETALAHNAGIICRTPICFGFLSGKLDADTSFAEGDHRANWPKDQLACWANAPALFAGIVRGQGQNYAQMALQFCLAQKAISTVIPGMMNARELSEDIAAVEHTVLNQMELDEIKRIYRSNTFFDKAAKSRGKQ